MFSNIYKLANISISGTENWHLRIGSKDRLPQPQGLPNPPDMLLLVPNPEEETQTLSLSVSRGPKDRGLNGDCS